MHLSAPNVTTLRVKAPAPFRNTPEATSPQNPFSRQRNNNAIRFQRRIRLQTSRRPCPTDCPIPDTFLQVEENLQRHETLLGEMQALRGERYLKDGAITSQELSPDGRHRVAVDTKSW